MDTCTTCRNPLVPGAKFCGLCGQRVDAPAEAPAAATPPPAPTPQAAPLAQAGPPSEPAPPVMRTPPPAAAPPTWSPVTSAPPPPPPPPSRPRRQVPGGVIAAVAAALLLVAGLVVGVLLLGGDDQPSTTASAGTVAETGTDPAPTETSPTPSAAAEDVRCWNGESRPSVDECAPVRGVAGMRWAMPPFDRRFGQCEPATAYDGKVRAFGCTLTTARGYTAKVTFSEWSSYDAGDEHYREKYGAPDRTDSQFNIWDPTFVKDDFQTSRMFAAGLPFSVTVSSGEEKIAEAVMSGFFFRPDSDVAPYLG